jgi:hypothetical protein
VFLSLVVAIRLKNLDDVAPSLEKSILVIALRYLTSINMLINPRPHGLIDVFVGSLYCGMMAAVCSSISNRSILLVKRSSLDCLTARSDVVFLRGHVAATGTLLKHPAQAAWS